MGRAGASQAPPGCCDRLRLRGPRDVIRSACAWKHIFESTSYIFEAAGWAARGCADTVPPRGVDLRNHANAACGARAADTAQAGGASVQLLAERRAESASLNKNREALYALAQAGRRGVRVDGTRQVQ